VKSDTVSGSAASSTKAIPAKKALPVSSAKAKIALGNDFG
jgi:hypothetical protein